VIEVGVTADQAVTRLAAAWHAALMIIVLDALPLGIPLLQQHYRTQIFVRFFVLALIVNTFAIPAIVALASGRAATILAALRAGLSGFWKTLCCTLAATLFVGMPVFVVLAMFSGILSAAAMESHPLAVTLVALGVALCCAPVVTVVALMYPIALLEKVGALEAWGLAWSRGVLASPRRGWFIGCAIVLIGYFPGVAFVRSIDALCAQFDLVLWPERPIAALVQSFTGIGLTVAFATVLATELRQHAQGSDLEAALEAPRSP
jgi:hypothetical protein